MGSKVEGVQRRERVKARDPLSPLLCVLAIEYLTRLTKKNSSQAEFKFHPYCKDLKLAHLIFADNVIIFSKAHPPTLRLIMQIFKEFNMATGLQVNPNKSQVILRGYSEALSTACLQETVSWKAHSP